MVLNGCYKNELKMDHSNDNKKHLLKILKQGLRVVCWLFVYLFFYFLYLTFCGDDA